MHQESFSTYTGNDSTPLISVVLPVYNGEKHLAEAVGSVLAQTFWNFELIIIDDGSTDGSLRILQDYQKRDGRIRLISRENRGLATTLNDSIEIARGEWLARMDQDDIALPYRFERQQVWLNKTRADISGSWVRRFGSPDKRVVRFCQADEAIKMEMLFCSPFAHPAVMVRTSLVKSLRYDQAFENAEDYDLWTRAAEAGWKMTNVPEVLLLYRIHSAQISNKTADFQQQRGQEVRRRYWQFVFHTRRLNKKLITGSLKIFEPATSEIDMDALDASLADLLLQTHGESRRVIFNHATRLHFRAAPNCSNIVSRWRKLNRQFGNGWGGITILMLWVFRFLKIRTGGNIFRQLRRLHVRRTL
jgi:glycosyltransferase involved in cell wall biosynthesis